MQNPRYLHDHGYLGALRRHYGNSDRTLVMGEVPVGWDTSQREGIRIPDLLIAFNVDRAGILERNGYSIHSEGKPPDFALEIASATTGFADYNDKRLAYQSYRIPEYWRFDPSGGRYHDVALAGDRLADGVYRPISIEWMDPDHGRGYSETLGLYICWEEGLLKWYDPLQGRYLRTIDDEAERADQAENEVRRLQQQLRDLAG